MLHCEAGNLSIVIYIERENRLSIATIIHCHNLLYMYNFSGFLPLRNQ